MQNIYKELGRLHKKEEIKNSMIRKNAEPNDTNIFYGQK